MAAASTIALIAMAAAAAMSAAAQAKQAKAQAASARFNAAAQRQRAERQRKVAKVQADTQRRAGSRKISQLRARSSGRGLAGLGSPLLVAQDVAAVTELTALTTLANGLTGAAGLDINASLLRFNATQTEQIGAIRAGSTLLSGFGRAVGGINFSGGGPDAASPIAAGVTNSVDTGHG